MKNQKIIEEFIFYPMIASYGLVLSHINIILQVFRHRIFILIILTLFLFY